MANGDAPVIVSDIAIFEDGKGGARLVTGADGRTGIRIPASDRVAVAAALLPAGTVPVERVAAVIAATRLAYDHATKAPPGATYWCRGQLSAGALEQLRRALAAYDAAGPAAG